CSYYPTDHPALHSFPTRRSSDLANSSVECVNPAEDPDTCTDTQLVVPNDSDIVQRRNYVLDQMQQPGGTPLTGDQLTPADFQARSEEHTSELQSRGHLVCRLLLE